MDAFQGELRFLGIDSSPAFVRAPEGSGCAERFIRTLVVRRGSVALCGFAVALLRAALFVAAHGDGGPAPATEA